MGYDAAPYTAVTSTLYRWFGLAGAPIQLGAILAAALLAYLVRGRPAFRWTLAGALWLVLSLLLWAAAVQPVKVAWGEALRTGPEVAQAEYMRLRRRWEYGQLAAFAAWLVGLCLLIRSVLVDTSRGGALERAARLSIVASCILAGIACGGERGMTPGDEVEGDAAEAADGSPVRGESIDTLVMESRGALAERPVAPLRIDGTCPFECCTYGIWTTTGKTVVYDQPDPGSAQRTLPAGARLEAETGFVVLMEIGVAVAGDSVRMYTEDGAERMTAAGDTLLVLDNVGEGFRRVWHEGSVLQTDAVSGFVPEGGVPPAEVLIEPRQVWWARVRTPDGRAGWLWMDRTPRMEGADACG